MEPDKDFIGRFKSLDNDQHRSAFLELYLHAFLRLQGYQVEIHKKAGDNSRKLPDFQAKKGELCIYIECTHSINPLEEKPGALARVNNILDVIEEIPLPEHLLSVNIETVGPNSLAKEHLVDFIKQFIDKRPESIYDNPKWVYSKDDWKIEFGVISTTKPTPLTIGSLMVGGFGFTNSIPHLNRALINKRASKYGNLQDPYIIAVNSHDVVLLDEDIGRALYGFDFNGKISVNSFFNNEGKPQNTRVSGVYIIKNLVHFNMDSVEITFWHNPWAINPLSNEHIITNQVRPISSDSKYIFHRTDESVPLSELMRIKAGYYNWLTSET